MGFQQKNNFFVSFVQIFRFYIVKKTNENFPKNDTKYMNLWYNK